MRPSPTSFHHRLQLPVLAAGITLDDLGVRTILARLADVFPASTCSIWLRCPERPTATPPAGALRTTESPLNANVLTIDGTYEDYRRKRHTMKARKELNGSWRLFARDATDTRFDFIRDVNEAMRLPRSWKKYTSASSRAASL